MMNQLRVLHIVPWFPHEKNPIEAIFIANHITSLKDKCINKVLHIQFDEGKAPAITTDYKGIPVDRFKFEPLINKWKFKERIAKKTILNYLKKNQDQIDVVNFYIAYPNALYVNHFKRCFPKLKFCITEQWSAYRVGFNIKEGHKGRRRIEDIFKNQVPLFTVSSALAEDIAKFSGVKDLSYSILPNIIQPSFQFVQPSKKKEFIFTSINSWSDMKNPFVLIEAFKELSEKYDHIKMVLGGSGTLDAQIQERITSYNLENKISFIGRLSHDEVKNEIEKCHVYCQSSHYETFSVVCVEALAVGRPVIATNIGGMKDFINSENGSLVNGMDSSNWANSMEEMMLNYDQYDFEANSVKICERYNKESISELFYKYLKEIE